MRENADQNNSEYGHFLRSDSWSYICYNNGYPELDKYKFQLFWYE